MGQAYPELVRAENLIEETLRLEETRFRKTLERGLTILDEKSASLKKGDMFDGDTAFTLYDTYGFPLDLTQDALRNRGIGVDIASFTDAMDRQRAKARAAWAGSGDTKTEGYWFPLREKYGATEFLGYDTETSEGVVQAIIQGGPETKELKAGESGEVILNQTPFYAESGGQVSDTGWMRRASDGALVARVLTCHKEAGDLFVHNVKVENHGLRVGDALRLEVDPERRAEIRRNHSATHLLHEALRQVLGDHIAQRGSLVAPERLRFDFSHPSPVSPKELERVEDLANKIVLQNSLVSTRLMDVNEAIESGARALFGEKYGEEVRVVAMGEPEGNAAAWSVELCGGTHVGRTGDIGFISIIGEAGVSSGVRRIEALTGHHARQYARHMMTLAKIAATELRTTVDELPARINSVMEESKKRDRDLSEARKKLAMGGAGLGPQLIPAQQGTDHLGDPPGIKTVAGVRFMPLKTALDAKELKPVADELKIKVQSGVIAIANTASDGRASLVVAVTSDLVGRFDAVNLVNAGAVVVGGKRGGGRPDMAQAGGPDGAKADAALSAIEKAMAGA
jgi:alanyl-tRNA synthetase